MSRYQFPIIVILCVAIFTLLSYSDLSTSKSFLGKSLFSTPFVSRDENDLKKSTTISQRVAEQSITRGIPLDNNESAHSAGTDNTPSRAADIKQCYVYHPSFKRPLPEAFWVVRQCKRRIPRAMVVGYKKCGTGTLSRFLDLHPAVSISHELKFPANDVDNASISEWVSQMPLSSQFQLPMTENPQFLIGYRRIFLALKPVLPKDAKFLVILRDPVQRAVSDYLHDLTHSGAPTNTSEPFERTFKGDIFRDTFERTVFNPDTHELESEKRIIKQSKYIESIRSVLSVYQRKQFHFIDGNAFAEDPFPIMQDIERFLGLPTFYARSHFIRDAERGFFCANVKERPDFRCMQPGKGRPHPSVSEDALKELYDFYRPYNRALAEEIGLHFPWLKS
ncbi:heparan sulfate glucosamine 3-O-sulfotransferase 5-like [Diadema antillarum]|uniref:heparan sulfate glucosamine 3-O-sulfotransferase 5-like n=1 Tax=Diadema antillarum TaxID=105358 RepID=UPI003A863906